MNFGEQRVPLYQLLDTNTTIRMNNYRSVTIAANMNRALCHFLFSFSSLISTMNFNFGNEHKSYVQLSVINKFSSILEYRLFLSLFISLSLYGQRLFLIRFNFRTYHCRNFIIKCNDLYSLSNFNHQELFNCH